MNSIGSKMIHFVISVHNIVDLIVKTLIKEISGIF